MSRRPSLFTLLLLGTASLVAPTATAQQDTPPAPQPAAEVPTLQEAGALLQQGDLQAASVAYAKIVLAQPENAQAWQMLGYSLHMSGDLDRALRVHTKAATFDAVRPIALYNIACVHALQGRADEAFAFLEQAVEAGFNDPNQYGSDADLRSLHSDPRWVALGRKLQGLEVGEPAFESQEWTEAEPTEAAEAAALKKRGRTVALASVPVEQQFDFWLGEWDVAMNGDFVTEWKVAKELDGKVIRQSGPYSMTVVNFEPTTGKWHMTWMSTEGHHDVLVGAREGDAMVMHQKVVREEAGAIGRWTLHDIHKNYFATKWELSRDNGKTWTTEATMECWRKGAAQEASASAAGIERYEFLLGEFSVEYKAMMPDQSWVAGKGSCSAKRMDNGAIVEKQKLTQEDGTVWEGVTTRSLDPESGRILVNWTSADGQVSVDSKAALENGKVVEISGGEDQYGAFRDRPYFTEIDSAGYSVWLDRYYTESGTTIEGLYRARYSRK